MICLNFIAAVLKYYKVFFFPFAKTAPDVTGQDLSPPEIDQGPEPNEAIQTQTLEWTGIPNGLEGSYPNPPGTDGNDLPDMDPIQQDSDGIDPIQPQLDIINPTPSDMVIIDPIILESDVGNSIQS